MLQPSVSSPNITTYTTRPSLLGRWLSRWTLMVAATVASVLIAHIAVAQPSEDASADPTGDFSIVNGQITPDASIPAYVQMLAYDNGRPFHNCGGTILTKDWILTAGHCVWDTTKPDERFIRAHSPTLFRVYHPETKELREIDRIEIPHAEQSKQWHNDIALLHLRTPLSTNARATLSAPNLPIIRAGHGVVWGKGQFSMNNPGGILRADYATLRLRKAQVPINKPAFCGKPAYGQHLLCAETPSTNGSSPASCSGDSGGPLTIFSDNPNTQLQVGVVSHAEQVPGRPFCGGQPTWYTSVSHWAPWINERVAGVKYGTYRINPADGAPMAPTPAPAPAPSLTSCGNVNHPGSAVPGTSRPDLAWVPARGQGAGSTVSVAASTLAWPSGQKADYAILAGECAWADALAATSLLGRGPLLLTNPNQAESAVINEIKRLGVKQVYVVGGAKAVATNVTTALTNAGLRVTRVSGPSRVETAANVARLAKQMNPNLQGVVVARAYPASGGSPSQAFADSLAGAYMAPWTGSAIVLSATDSLSPASAAAITELKPKAVGLLGGSKALSAQVERRLAAIAGQSAQTYRIGGVNRDDTARMVGAGLMNSPGGAKGVLIIDGHADDAWKVGFTFGGLAAKERNVYAIANGDRISTESATLIKQAKKAGLPVRCVASAQACAKAKAL